MRNIIARALLRLAIVAAPQAHRQQLEDVLTTMSRGGPGAPD